MADISIDIYGCIQNISRRIDTYIETETQFFDTDESESIEDVKSYFLGTNTIQDVMREIDLIDSFFKSHPRPKSRSRKRKGDFGISTEQSLGQFKTAATSSSNVTAPSISDQFIFDLRRKMRIFTNRAFTLGLMDIQMEHHYISVVEDGLELLCKEQPLFKEELRSSMTDGEETKEEPRYLVVSSGCAVCILDLKQSKEEQRPDDQVLALPKRAILKLIDKQLPVSVGLFKFGSYAYMTGGHEFSRQEDSENSSSDCKLYKHLWVKGCFKGTSRATYRLMVDKEEDGKMTLFPSKCDDMGLLSPKFWPIVEEIGKELHVFDSTPSNIQANADESWIFSHEVLGRDLVSTTGVPSEQGFIYSHVVVGHRIYALAGEKNLLYENKKWQVYDRVYDWMRSGNAWEVKTVWDILECGNASCVGKAGGSEPNSEELYVIIAVVRNNRGIDGDYIFRQTTASYACLVTLKGDVVCIQPLHHLFLKTKLEPYDMVQGSVIKAGTDVWAAIVIGEAFANETRVDDRDYLFIYTFTVKDCIRAVSDTLKKRADEYLEETGRVMVADFVRVDVKARYIYKPNADFDDDADFAYFVGLRACFLDSL